MAEAIITRTQIIVVGEVSKNSYGDLTFSDKEGKQYKISAKRISYFEKVIIPEMAIQLNFATAYNKEYIYSAVLVKDAMLIKEPAKVEAPPPAIPEIKQPKTEMSKDDWAEKDRITRRSIERQKSLEMAVEVAKIKGSDDTVKIIATAKLFEAYLEGESNLIREAKKLGAVKKDK